MRVIIYSAVGQVAFLDRLASELQALGHSVELRSAISSRDYRKARSALGRVWVRWLIYGDFLLRTTWDLLFRRAGAGETVRIATTNPFLLPPVVAWFCRRRGEHAIFLVYDLFPDALKLAGSPLGTLFGGPLGRVTGWCFRSSSASVFLGGRLRAYAEKQHGRAFRSTVIAVGADGSDFVHRAREAAAPGADISITYTGLLGRMHDHRTIASVLQSPLPHVRLRFFASGSGYAVLRQSVPSANADFLGTLEHADWVDVLSRSPVGLITLAAGAENISMPSKTYTSLVAGQAILAICSLDSDLADLVRAHRCGWVVPPGDTAGLRAALGEIVSDPVGLDQKRQRAYAAGHAHYDMRPVASEWGRLLQSLP